jgi:hypothetical protein
MVQVEAFKKRDWSRVDMIFRSDEGSVYRVVGFDQAEAVMVWLALIRQFIVWLSFDSGLQ